MKLLAFHAHSGDPLSMLIKAATRSQYCHGAVLVDSPKWAEKFRQAYGLGDGLVIVEAYFPHVRARVLDAAELPEIDVIEVIGGISCEVEEAAMQWAFNCCEAAVKYGIADLFRFTAPGRAVLGENDDASFLRHTICSQFAFNVFRMGGLRLLNCHDYEVSPDKLAWSPLTQFGRKLQPITTGGQA